MYTVLCENIQDDIELLLYITFIRKYSLKINKIKWQSMKYNLISSVWK